MRIIHMGDIHINNKDPYRYYNEELSEIIDQIEKIRPDLVVLSGDYWSFRYRSDDPAILVGLRFMSEILELGKARGYATVIMRGTIGHDYDQLKQFEHHQDNYEFKIVYEEPEDIEFGEVVLRFVPEQYVESYDEFLKKVCSSPCHAMFFHGTLDGAIPMVKHRGDILTMKDSPVIKAEDISDVVRLFATGSHIHTRMELSNNVWYVGSLSSNNFADSNQLKGFDVIEINDDGTDYEFGFVENKNAVKYKTFEITELLKTTPSDKLMAKIYELERVEDTNTKKRLEIDLSGMNLKQIDKFNLLKAKFSNKFKFKTKKKISTKSIEQMEQMEKASTFVLSREIPEETKVAEVLLTFHKEDLEKLAEVGRLVKKDDKGNFIVDEDIICKYMNKVKA